MLEPSGFIGRLVGAFQSSPGATEELSAGGTVRARVLSRVSGQVWRLAIGGRVVEARVTVPLRQGQVFLARVEHTANEIILRRILSPRGGTPLERITSAAGVPNDALAQGIITHLVHAQRSLDPQYIARLYRLARRLGVTDRRGARLAAAVGGKGLSPESAAAFRALLDEVDLPDNLDDDTGRNRDGGGRGDTSGRDGGDGGGGGRDGRDRRGGHSDEGGPDEGDRDAARQLSEIVRSREATGAGEEPPHPLHAFNHLAGPDGQWVAVPLRFTAGDEERRAVLRLYRPRPNLAFDYAVLEVALPGRRISFTLHRDGDGYRVAAHTHEGDAAAAREVAELLRSHQGITELVFGESLESFDGFSTEDLSAIVYGIDTDV